MLERESLIYGLLALTRLLIIDTKVLDSKGKEVVKPPFLHGDTIPTDDFVGVAEERRCNI